MLTTIQRESIKKWANGLFQADDKAVDIMDIEHEIDNDLSILENKRILREKIRGIINTSKTEVIVQEKTKRKEAEMIPKQAVEEYHHEQIKNIEKQAELEFTKALEKIEKDKTTSTIEDFYYVPKQFAKMVANGNSKGFICFGEAGIGKSYCIMRAFREAGVSFKYLSGHITSLELYNFLYENRNEHIVFDDVNILDNENNLNMLKACLNSNSRVVSYHTTSNKLKVPNKFLFSGSITILINEKSNNSESLRAVESRVLNYELKMSYEDKMKILYELSKQDYEGLNLEERQEIVKWLKENTSKATLRLNLRLLFQIYEIYKFNKENWKYLASKIIIHDENKELIVQGLNYKEWCEKTGKHIATYYRYKKEMGFL